MWCRALALLSAARAGLKACPTVAIEANRGIEVSGRAFSGTALHPVRAHVLRSVSLYIVALVLGAPIVHDISKPEFWQFGQLVLWVWLTAVSGIVTDALWAASSVGTLTQTAVSTTSPTKSSGTS